MTEKRFRVNDLVKYNYSEIGEYIDENHTDRPLMNNKVCELLNEQHETIERLKQNIDELMCVNVEEELLKENEQLNQLLDYADDLIQSHLSEHFIRQWRNFKTGHKEYNDFWEEKLKTHKKLKGDVE